MKESDDCVQLLHSLETKWDEEREQAYRHNKSPSIMRAFIKAYWCRFISFTMLGFVSEAIVTAMVFFIRYLIEFI